MNWLKSILIFSSLLVPALLPAAGPRAAPPLPIQEPHRPVLQDAAGLTELYPSEGRPGEELVLNLEGFGLLESGEFLGTAIGGLDVPVLDFFFESDNFGQVRVLIPEDLPPGEGPIAFFFEGAVLEAPFLVLAPSSPAGPEPTGPSGPADGPICSPACVIIVIVVVILVGVGVVRAVRGGEGGVPGPDGPGPDAAGGEKPDGGERDQDEPGEDEPPIDPGEMGFDPEIDGGVQRVRPTGQPIEPDVDLEVDVSLESSEPRIRADGPIVDEAGITMEEGGGR